MKILVYGYKVKTKDIEIIKEVFSSLKKKKHEVFVTAEYGTQLKSANINTSSIGRIKNHNDVIKVNPDFVFSLGGDGTILRTVTLVRGLNIPIVGINLGRMGFLANIEQKLVSTAIDQIERGMYTLDQRKLLYLESNKPIFGETPFALNDFTLLKRDTSAMVVIHAYINGDFLNSYWADGIILSTPTGSTGYSLSCGGPIVFPNSGNFVLTPVAPHNLNVRPIIIPDTSVVSFEIEGRSDTFLSTLDSRHETIDATFNLAIRKCDFEISLVQLHGMTFLKTIQEKLTWGADIRN
ncbi:MAG: NAD kinase [Bacteroidota bacterium]